MTKNTASASTYFSPTPCSDSEKHPSLPHKLVNFSKKHFIA